MQDLLPRRTVGRAAGDAGKGLGDEAVAAGAALQHDHCSDQGDGDDGHDDGPRAVGPAPAGFGQEALADEAAEVEGGDRGYGLGQRGPEGAVDEVGGVGDEDLLREPEARGSDCVK